MSKDYSWWMGEFKQSLPVYIADFWCKNNTKYINAECERLGMKAMLAFTGGSINQEAIAKWLVQNSCIMESIIEELMASDHPLFKDFLQVIKVEKYTKPSSEKSTIDHVNVGGLKQEYYYGSKPLEWKLETVLTAYIKNTPWYVNNISEMRKEGRKLISIKAVMES